MLKERIKITVIGMLLASMLFLCLVGCAGMPEEPNENESDTLIPVETESESVVFESKSESETKDPEPIELATVKNGKKVSNYAIVFSEKATYRALARKLYDVLVSFPLYLDEDSIAFIDDFEKRPKGVKLILIGDDLDSDKYPEMNMIPNDRESADYGIIKTDDNLVVWGNNFKTVSEAVELVKTKFKKEAKWEGDRLTLKLDEQIRVTDDSLLSDFPRFNDKQQIRYYYNNDNELAYEYDNVTRAQYDAYVSELATAGYVDKQGGHQIGRNLFATCTHPEKGQLHLTYFPSANADSGELTVFATKLEKTAAIPEDTYDPDTDKVTDAVFHVMSLDYTHRGASITDGNGMCYIMTLKDGRFVVFDGGYDSDATNIYDYMKAMNKRADGKIVVAAWFMSHPDGDHYYAFDKFMGTSALYHNVTVEYFVANASIDETWMNTKLPALLKRGNIQLIKPHTGQVLSFAGTKFEIILSRDVLNSPHSNEMSTVVRVVENGHTILLSGDAMEASCKEMVSLYGDSLKSDVLQINHHGHSGGTVAFYEKVAPTYALWTTSQDGFDGRIEGKGNCAGSAPTSNVWIRDNVGIENCLVADDEIEQIFMPEDGEIRIVTDTGYRITSNYPKQEGDGVLQLPITAD